MVEKTARNYCLGMGLFELGNKVPVKQLVIDKIHPILKDLCDEVNETVNFAQLFRDSVLYLDRIESKRSLQVQFSVGDLVPLYCTGLGKAILSILPVEDLSRVLNRIELQKITPLTIKNKDELFTQIKDIKSQGYSVDNEELEEGLKCVAVPLSMEQMGFFGSISVSGPSIRFTRSQIKMLAGKLKSAVDTIKNQFANDFTPE
jgi:DNA-binding IclR family transcriptional regulator